MTEENGDEKEEKNPQSVLDFTFKRLDEAIAQAGKTLRRTRDDDGAPLSRKKRAGTPPYQEEGDEG